MCFPTFTAANNEQGSNPGRNDGCHRLYKAARLGLIAERPDERLVHLGR